MAAVMRLVNRSNISSAMGRQYLALSSSAKVKALSCVVLLSSITSYCARLVSSPDSRACQLAVLYG